MKGMLIELAAVGAAWVLGGWWLALPVLGAMMACSACGDDEEDEVAVE